MKKLLLLTILIYGFQIHAQIVSILLDNPNVNQWTVPAGVYSVTVECWGAGGGGARSTSSGFGRGAGGGAYARLNTLNVTPGQVISYSIGQGGSGGNVALAQKHGGDTWFLNTSTVRAQGGRGASNNSSTGGLGGAATSSIGNVRYSGGRGGNGRVSSGNNAEAGSGGGGAGSTGNGSPGQDGQNNGTYRAGGAGAPDLGGQGGFGAGQADLGGNGFIFGGGGGGAKKANICIGCSDHNGGNGARGAIRLTYCSAPNNLNVSTNQAICSGQSVNLSASATPTLLAGQTTLNYSGTGRDCDNFIIGGVTSGLPAGSIVTGITIDATIGNNCPIWYEWDLFFDGNYLGPGCNSTGIELIGVSGLQANGRQFNLRSWDNDNFCDIVTMTLGVNLRYTYPATSVSYSWIPSTGLSSSSIANPTASPTSTTTYNLTASHGGCAAPQQSVTVTVNQPPSAGTLSGNQNICQGSNTTFSSTVTGGTWSSSNTSVATINSSSGLITGVGVGTATMTYTVSGSGCPNATATRTVTVTAPPSAGNLSGTQNICQGGTTTFSSTVTGGTWSSSNTAIATINSSSGLITGVGAGTATMTYSVSGSGGCSNDTASRTVTVASPPSAGTLSGTQEICQGSTTSFTSSSTGGLWSSSNTSVATINSSSGLITGVGVGTATMTYTVSGSGGCSNATASRNVTVSAPPSAGTLSGIQSICEGSNTTFSSTVTGGTWSSSNTTVATINSTSGLINGVGAGTATMTYTVSGSGGCSNAIETRDIILEELSIQADSISSQNNVCLGDSILLSVAGGSLGTAADWFWYADSCGGNVLGTGKSIYVSPNSNTTYYLRAEGNCNTSNCVQKTIFVDSPPEAGIISAQNQFVCEEDSVFLEVSGHVGSDQWQIDTLGFWQDLVGANLNTYSNSISLSANYRTMITNGVCSPAFSDTVFIGLNAFPFAGVAVSNEDSLCFGQGTFIRTLLSFGDLQWQINDNGVWNNIAGAVNDTLFVNNLTESQEYRVISSNGLCNPDTSAIERIVVLDLPNLPNISDKFICNDGIINFNINPVHQEVFDWSLDSINIIATSDTLSTPNIFAPDTLIYFVRSRELLLGCISEWQEVRAIALENIPPPQVTDIQFCGSTQIVYNVNPGLNQIAEWSEDTFNLINTGNQYDAGFFPAPSTDSIYVRYLDTLLGCLSDWVVIKANIFEIPSPPNVLDEVLCGSGIINFSTSPQTNNVSEWSLDTSLSLSTFSNNYNTPNLNLGDTILIYVRYQDTLSTCFSSWTEVVASSSLQLEAGQINNSQQICINDFPFEISSIAPAISSGNGGQVSYQWQISENCDSVWQNIPNALGISFTENSSFQGEKCYRRVATNNCGSLFSNEITIEVFPEQNANILGLNSSYCANDSLVLLSSDVPNGVFSGNGVSGNTFAPSSSIIGQVAIQYDYTDSNGCNNSVTDTTIVNDIPIVNIDNNLGDFCANDSQVVLLSATPTGGTFTGLGVSGNEFSPSLSVVGNQQITYEHTDTNNCSNSTTVSFMIFPTPQVSFDTWYDTLCTTSPIFTISNSPTGGTLIGTHTNNILSPNNLPLGNNQFTYTYTDANGCSDDVTENIWINQGEIIQANDTIFSIIGSENIEVNITNNDIGNWDYFGVNYVPLNGAFVEKNGGIISFAVDLNYTGQDSIIYIICDNECNNCDTAKVILDILSPELTVPNGFSPDGDGFNDFFVIDGLETRYPNNELTIVNRWGNRVFSAKPYRNNWDGTSDNSALRLVGNQVTDGTYFYILDLGDGEKPKKGYIELKRSR